MLNNKFVLLTIALFAVSSSAWVVRLLQDTNAVTLAFWRMFLATIAVFLLSYKTISKFVPNKKMEVAGVFLGLHFALFFRAVQLPLLQRRPFLEQPLRFLQNYIAFFLKRGDPLKWFCLDCVWLFLDQEYS